MLDVLEKYENLTYISFGRGRGRGRGSNGK